MKKVYAGQILAAVVLDSPAEIELVTDALAEEASVIRARWSLPSWTPQQVAAQKVQVDLIDLMVAELTAGPPA